MKRMLYGLLAILLFPTLLGATGWSLDPSVPDYDKRWTEVASCWQNRQDPDRMLVLLQELEKAYPDRVEPQLWLARVHLAQGHDATRIGLVETHAARAYGLDPGNRTAIRLLAAALPYTQSRDEIMAKYGKWMVPFSTALMVPEMSGPQWKKAFDLYMQRTDNISYLQQAATEFSRIADSNPQDGRAQTWASFVNFDLANYYNVMGDYESEALPLFLTATEYGRRAVKLLPQDVPANFWYQASLGQSIIYDNIFKKVGSLNEIYRHLKFCHDENPTYNHFATAHALIYMIIHGGSVTQKGLEWAGISLDQLATWLDMSRILYPDNLGIYKVQAEFYLHQGRRDEALRLLEEMLQRDPEADPLQAFSNRLDMIQGRRLYAQLKDP